MKDSKKRISYIDVAKGIGLFLVVWGHLVPSNSITFRVIFSFHMPLFFILSGMNLNVEKYNNFLDFLKRKARTLILPYFFFSLLGIILSFSISSARSNITIQTIIKQYLYITQPEIFHVGQLWFLIALLVSSILFYIIEKYVLKDKTIFFKFMFYLILSVIGFNIIKYIKTTSLIKVPYGRLPFKLDSALTIVIFLKIGNLITKYSLIDRITKISNMLYFWLLLLLLFSNFIIGVVLNGYVNICDCTYGYYINYYLSSIFGSLFVILFSYKIKESRILCYYGKNSLFMFSIHSLLIWLYISLFSKGYIIFPFNSYFLNRFLVAGVITVLLFPLSALYNCIIKYVGQYKIVKKERE